VVSLFLKQIYQFQIVSDLALENVRRKARETAEAKSEAPFSLATCA
jgi:hypothetical protein